MQTLKKKNPQFSPFLRRRCELLPGRKPGTSTKVMMGILKASQKRTKRAPFTEELMSKQPDGQTRQELGTAEQITNDFFQAKLRKGRKEIGRAHV